MAKRPMSVQTTFTNMLKYLVVKPTGEILKVTGITRRNK